MADYTATSDMSFETAISNGSMVDGEVLTIARGVTVTCTQTPSILVGGVIIYGELHIDGANISSGNMINFVIDNGGSGIQVLPDATFRVTGDWYNVGTTDGTNSQSVSTSAYWGSFCVDHIPMVQIETGRRIYYDNESGTTPAEHDWVVKDSDRSVIGRIVSIDDTSKYMVVRFLTGTLADDDDIFVDKMVDNTGPDMQRIWTAKVNNASGDIAESGVYQQFGNSYEENTSFIGSFHLGIGGFVFDNVYQAESITLGSAASTTGGFVPPSGGVIRVPNVHFSQATTTTYASSQVSTPATTYTNRIGLTASPGASVYLSICNVGLVRFLTSTAQVFNCSYVGASVGLGNSNSAYSSSFYRCLIVPDPQYAASATYNFGLENLAGSLLEECMVISPTSDIKLSAFNVPDVEYQRCYATILGDGTYNETYLGAKYCPRAIINGCAIVGPTNTSATSLKMIWVEKSDGSVVSNTLFCGCQDEVRRLINSSVVGITVMSNNCIIKGIQYVNECVVPGRQMYITAIDGIKIRAIGMITEKIDMSVVTFIYLYSYQSTMYNLDVARVWTYNHSEEVIGFNFLNTSMKNCSTDYGTGVAFACPNGGVQRGVHAGGTGVGGYGERYHMSGTSMVGSYGRNIHDHFLSDTGGIISCIFVPPSQNIDNITVVAGYPVFQGDGTLDLVAGDIVEIAQDYFSLGHTGFTGVLTAALSGSTSWYTDNYSNVDLYFQYDTGSGWNGSWLDARTATNWTSITGTVDGVRLKWRFEATGTQANLWVLCAHTTTTLADQAANLYPIDQETVAVTVTLKDFATRAVIPGAMVRIEADAGGPLTEGDVLFYGFTDSNGNASIPELPYSANQPIRGDARKGDAVPYYEPQQFSAVVTSAGLELVILMVEED